MALGPDGWTALSTSDRLDDPDGKHGSFRAWDLRTGTCISAMAGNVDCIWAVAITPDGQRALSGSRDGTVGIWDIGTGRCLALLAGHTATISSICVSRDGRRAVSASRDKTLRVWDLERLACLGMLEGHDGGVGTVQLTKDGRWAVSTAEQTGPLRVWNVRRRRCVAELYRGAATFAAALDIRGRRALSVDSDGVWLWDLVQRTSTSLFEVHGFYEPDALVFSVDGTQAYGCTSSGILYVLDLPPPAAPAAIVPATYTSAKILVVGDSGVGKTALARRLTEDRFEATVSTDGVAAQRWAAPTNLDELPDAGGVEREIWLWDFAGQADYRLVHQLYMEQAALAILVFDPQADDVLDRLAQWDRAVERAAAGTARKILVAGRIDRGRPTVPHRELERFCREHGYAEYIETSALDGTNCEALREAIVRCVPWEGIAWATSAEIFHLLREEIVTMKEEGITLLRPRELAGELRLRLPEETFTEDDLRTVVHLLGSAGVVWQLAFGDFVLLQPEIVSSYSAAVIRSVRSQPDEIGCIAEEDVLAGKLDYRALQRLPRAEEQIVLRAMHHTLLERGLCLREHTDRGTLLVFPAYLKQERPELQEHPPILVTYRFQGFLDEIFASLITRLQHTDVFQRDRLWRFAADYRTAGGHRLGLKMAKQEHGIAELDIYFDLGVPLDLQVTFIRWVHARLGQTALQVERIRSYVCARCHHAVESPKTIASRHAARLADVFCPNCGARVPLNDAIEQLFASPQLARRAHRLDARAASSLDNESKELQLVGHLYATVAEAGHIYRQYTNSDHGIDGEIEFKDERGRATGDRLYLQLKSGDSYLRRRRRDDAEIFTVRKARWIDYWRRQAYPVMLVVRASNGEVRWMNVTDWIQRNLQDGAPVHRIVFEGEGLTAESVRRLAAAGTGLLPA